MAIPTKIKTRSKAGTTEILCLVKHPMETGRRIDKKTKQKIPAHYIQKLVFKVNGKQVAEADTGTGISKDPVFIVRVKELKPGDAVEVSWTDNKGQKGGKSTTVA